MSLTTILQTRRSCEVSPKYWVSPHSSRALLLKKGRNVGVFLHFLRFLGLCIWYFGNMMRCGSGEARELGYLGIKCGIEIQNDWSWAEMGFCK